MGNTDSRLVNLEKLNKELKKEELTLIILKTIKEKKTSIDELISEAELNINQLEEEIAKQKEKFNKEVFKAQTSHDELVDWYY